MSFRSMLAVLFVGLASQTLAYNFPTYGCLPYQVQNATFLPKIYLADSSLTYRCHENYELEGESVLTCLPGGDWDHPAPVCRPLLSVQCRRPLIGEELLIATPSDQVLFNVDEKIRFRCELPYTLVGTAEIVCQSSGEFSAAVPKCVVQQCERPKDPTDGEVVSRNNNQQLFNAGQNVWFKCDDEFDLVGTRDFVCQADGEWTPQRFPRCVRRVQQCERPEDPTDGEVVSRNNNQQLFNAGQNVWFKCNDGFDLVGTRDFVCQADGKWIPQRFPRCLRRVQQCERPEDPADGEVVSRNNNQQLFNANQNVWFKCDDGFDLVGTRDFVCQADGEWIPQRFPKCVRRGTFCPRPKDPENGAVGGPKLLRFRPGQKVRFVCNAGFRLDGEENFVCQRSGEWEPSEFPRCIPTFCPRPKNPENGAVSGPKLIRFRPGQKVRFVCNAGFKLDGAENFVCQSSGEWKPSKFPRCIPEREICRRPDNPENGVVIGPDPVFFSPGQKVRFQCNYGFVLVGDEDFTCQRNGNWKPKIFPTCLEKSRLQTVVACEGDFKKSLRCPRGSRIYIARGFYGRNDRVTCPHKAIHTDKCFAKNSFKKLQKMCNKRYACRLRPTNWVYGNPCRGTYKYVEVDYYCRKY